MPKETRAAREIRQTEVRVDAVGARGDGIAITPDGPLYIPFAAPGDRLRVLPGDRCGSGRAAAIVALLEPGPDRIAPRCRHFGLCGACALQHLAARACATVKRRIVAAALARRGLDGTEITSPVATPPGTRRRLRIAFSGAGRRRLGFRERGSRRIVDIRECPVAHPTLTALFNPMRRLLADLDTSGGEATLTATESGIDLLIAPTRACVLDRDAREMLAAFAAAHDLARISWAADEDTPEPVVERRPPFLHFGGVEVRLPPGAFVQPSAEGEAAIVAIAADAVRGARRIADLYAGCGSLSFPLARIAPVHAFEGDAAMTEALARAAGGRRVTAERRDLARAPLAPDELAPFDAVVFDPPRAGARTQAAAIAASRVATVVAVSCNPATLARDLRLLVDGGYTMERVTPIDQFTWSAQIEAVAVLRRRNGRNPSQPIERKSRG